METTATEYTNKRGEVLTMISAYVPLAAWQEARSRRMNISAICSEAIEAAVQEAGHGSA